MEDIKALRDSTKAGKCHQDAFTATLSPRLFATPRLQTPSGVKQGCILLDWEHLFAIQNDLSRDVITAFCHANFFFYKSSAETQQLGFRLIEHDFSDLNGLLNTLNSCKTRECALCLLS